MDRPTPVVVAVLTRDHETFLVQRARGQPLPGQWEFPGGKVEFGEAPLDTLRRELKEELGLRLETATLLGIYSHVYVIRRKKVHYLLIAYHHRMAPDLLPERESARWFGREQLRALPVVAGSKPIVDDLFRLWRVT